MTTEKLEYDSTLGGPVKLPGHVSTYRYAAGAVKEIKELLAAVRHPTSTKLIFQTLPKHMRRRAMSHHPKRLPRKYRTAHRSQMAKAGKPPQTTKRPSRKHRRRPSNLLRNYLRRQRRHVWLESHIWHARRFHMCERWGYRLPYASCDKTYRSCYRATAEHCLLQDISFYACIQLQGSLETIHAGFSHLTSPKCGLSITAKTFVSGRREGSIDLFRAQQYPEGALSNATFMWRPLEKKDNDIKSAQRTLWLWLHPSAYSAVCTELIKVFELKSLKTVKVPIVEKEETPLPDSDINAAETNTKKSHQKTTTSNKTKTPAKSNPQSRLQFITKTVANEHIKCYSNAQNTLQLSELKDQMNRFRLTGPLAHSVLAYAFHAYTVEQTKGKNWFQAMLDKEITLGATHKMQANYWQQCSKLSSSTELLSNMILSLNIDDPRIHRPQKRTKALPQMQNEVVAELSDLLIDVPSCLSAQSVLWDTQLRDDISAQMLTPQQYCELRAKHSVVPGAACQFEQEMQPVPLLLIQRPGSQHSQYKRLGYGCGWDVIAPAGYGMPIWLSLIMWGAKPGGLREFDSIARELGTEQHLPDTVCGKQTAAERYAELRSKYFRLPPNKRCSYRKFAIVSPFRAPLAQLVQDWIPNSETIQNGENSFFILRDRALLQKLQICLQQKHRLPEELPAKCLIQLQLRMKSRGNPDDFSLICLPTRADFKRNLKQIKFENHEPIFTEPLLPDPAEKERKLLRVEHKKLLKRMRARRVREKRKKQETSTTRVHIRAAGTSQLVAEQFKKMCSLWLPEDCSSLFSVRKQCTRDVFGYITSAHFSYIEATVCGVGYVTVEGLRQLLELCQLSRVRQPMCLVRGTTSRHYRFASFKLNLQV